MVTKKSFYSAVCTTDAPEAVITLIPAIAKKLDNSNYTLRSTGNPGIEQIFETQSHRVEYFIPWNGFNGKFVKEELPKEAFTIASHLHPAWHKLTNQAQKLKARSVAQLMGMDLKTPSDFLICWSPDGACRESEVTRITGSAGLSIKLATRMHIPVFNLQRQDNMASVKKLLKL